MVFLETVGRQRIQPKIFFDVFRKILGCDLEFDKIHSGHIDSCADRIYRDGRYFVSPFEYVALCHPTLNLS
jgi:hypothetical protein